MKQQIITLLLLLFCSNLLAQLPGDPLIDETSQWYFEGNFAYTEFINCGAQDFAIEKSKITYTIDGDTSINGQDYYKMHYVRIDSNYCSSNTISWMDTTSGLLNYLIREEGAQVMVYNSNNEEEVVWWDYENVAIGDTINNCAVASIDTLFLLYQPYLKYNCDCETEYQIPAVGTKRNLFATHNCGIGIEGDWGNMCYSKNGFPLSLSALSDCISTGDSSAYITNGTPLLNVDFNLAPNPTNDFTQIQFAQTQTGTYRLFSIDGNLLKTQDFTSNQLRIDFSSFPSGIYFIKLQLKDGRKISQNIFKQ